MGTYTQRARTVLLILLLGALAPGISSASPITYGFEGVFESIGTGAPVRVGDPFSSRHTVADVFADLTPDQQGAHSYPVLAAHLRVPTAGIALDLVSPRIAGFLVRDDSPGVEALEAGARPATTYPAFVVLLQYQFPKADFFSSGALPLEPIALEPLRINQFTVIFGDGIRAGGTIHSMSVTAQVAAPSPWQLMLLAGLVPMACRRRGPRCPAALRLIPDAGPRADSRASAFLRPLPPSM